MPNFYGVATMPLTPPPALEACLAGFKSDMLRVKWSCLIQTEPKRTPILLMRLPRHCSCLRCPHLGAAPCISIGSNEPIIAVSYSACLKRSFCKRTVVGSWLFCCWISLKKSYSRCKLDARTLLHILIGKQSLTGCGWNSFKRILQVEVATSPGCQDIAAYSDWETKSYRMSDCRLMPHNNCSKHIMCISNSFTLMKRGNTLDIREQT